MKPLTPTQALSAARKVAVDRVPYAASVIFAMPTEATTTLPEGVVFATTKGGVILYDAERLLTRSVVRNAASIAHEAVGHWAMRHFARAEALGATTPAEMHRVNLAGDCAIEAFLRDAFPEVKDWVGASTFGFPPELTMEAYYRLLADKAGEDGEDGHPEKGKGEGEGGSCGGCAGNPTEGEEDGPGGGGGPDGGTASTPGIPQEYADSLRASMAAAIQDAAKTAPARGKGSIPAEMLRWAGALLAPKPIDYEAVLRAAVRRAARHRPGFGDASFAKANKLQGAVGYGPGRPILAGPVRPIPEVVVAVDTSGSMGSALMAQAAGIIESVLRSCGTRVRVIACDAAVHADGKVQSLRDVAGMLRGGGGTDFRPVFDRLAKGKRPDSLLFVTDGWGDAPARPPPYEVVWLLLGVGATSPCTWGTHVKIPELSGKKE